MANFAFKKSTLLIVALAVLIAVNVFVYMSLAVNTLPFAHVYEKNNVLFVSNDGNPFDLLKQFSTKDSLTVAPVFSDRSQTGNSVLVNNSALLFSTLAAANDQNMVFLVRNVTGDNDTLISCQSNLGDEENVVQLDVGQCDQVWNSASARVLVMHPSSQYKRSVIIVSPQEIQIVPISYDELKPISLVLAREMYSNTDDVVRRTQLLTQFVLNK